MKNYIIKSSIVFFMVLILGLILLPILSTESTESTEPPNGNTPISAGKYDLIYNLSQQIPLSYNILELELDLSEDFIYDFDTYDYYKAILNIAIEDIDFGFYSYQFEFTITTFSMNTYNNQIILSQRISNDDVIGIYYHINTNSGTVFSTIPLGYASLNIWGVSK